MADAIGYGIKLFLMIVEAIVRRKLETRRLKQEFEMDMKQFNETVQRCMVKMLDDARRESEQAKKVEDKIDEARKGK